MENKEIVELPSRSQKTLADSIKGELCPPKGSFKEFGGDCDPLPDEHCGIKGEPG
jgi:hypothetical protein